MRAMFLLTVLLTAVPDREDPTPKDKPKTPQELVLGDWLLESLNGRASNGPNQPILVFRVLANESIFLVNGQPSAADGLTAAITIDWSQNPVAIDFMPKQRGGKMPGILKVDADQMILGLTTGGDQRPVDFTKAQMVAQYKRIKK